MHVTFAPRDILQIDDATIIFKNFAGVKTKFNNEGNRNFAVVIDDEQLVNDLIELGWNVKIKPPRDVDDDPFMYLPVKVKFNDRGPNVYLKSGRNQVRLTEDEVDCLDDIDILSVDLDIRPFDWDVNGATGRTAYLQAIRVTQRVDRFTAEDEYED